MNNKLHISEIRDLPEEVRVRLYITRKIKRKLKNGMKTYTIYILRSEHKKICKKSYDLKEITRCACGGKFRHNKKRHNMSKRHLRFIQREADML